MIKKFISQLSDENLRLLTFELLLFSGVFGLANSSWLVGCLIFLSLFWVVILPRATVCLVVALSTLWGMIGASIGYSFGKGTWAMSLGAILFFIGILAHTSGLKRPWNKKISFGNEDTVEWKRSWFVRGQNLN